MLVSRISPAPSCCTRRAQSTASRPGWLRPPCVKTSPRPARPFWRRWRRRCTGCRPWPRFGDEIRIVDGGGVHAHLVGTRIEQPTNVGDRAHATADGQRDEHLRCARFDDVQDDVALVRRRGDVEEGHLVGALRRKRRAISTGSPASRRSTKLVPLTTRPAVTSRQGMMRFARPKAFTVLSLREEINRRE